MLPEHTPDWDWIEGEVAILAELVVGVAARGRCDVGAVLDAVEENLREPARSRYGLSHALTADAARLDLPPGE